MQQKYLKIPISYMCIIALANKIAKVYVLMREKLMKVLEHLCRSHQIFLSTKHEKSNQGLPTMAMKLRNRDVIELKDFNEEGIQRKSHTCLELFFIDDYGVTTGEDIIRSHMLLWPIGEQVG